MAALVLPDQQMDHINENSDHEKAVADAEDSPIRQ